MSKKPTSRDFSYVPTTDIVIDDSKWIARNASISIEGKEAMFTQFMHEMIEALPDGRWVDKKYRTVMKKYARLDLPWLSKTQLLSVYYQLCATGVLEESAEFIRAIQTKPTRSQAGVAVVTVLTKPYPCPGKCIFCPTDVRMPKSYLHDEPGAQRAERHQFDPYDQTFSRLEALQKMGHPTDKIELIILGGTWSSYRRDYQEWFVKRCFGAMNGVDSADLLSAQMLNASTHQRNVGLVIETRQDHVNVDELRWLRYLGVTKVQVGIQSMDEKVLELNKRGHDAQSTRDAFRLLRLAGFKIHGHWMANLLGSTMESDIADYQSLWDDPTIQPDELKIYPCMLVENAELHDYYLRGEYKPYTEDEVTDVLVQAMARTPRFCRLTRVIRDIPTTNVVEGNKKANLRQIAQKRMDDMGLRCQDIRAREIRRDTVSLDELQLQVITYETDATTEHFLSFETAEDRLAGFLRLSFPHQDKPHVLPELEGHAMIREVHVYGPVVELLAKQKGKAQHIGVGSQLVNRAKELAKEAGYAHLSVISAIGTQGYYGRKHDFKLIENNYMAFEL